MSLTDFGFTVEAIIAIVAIFATWRTSRRSATVGDLKMSNETAMTTISLLKEEHAAQREKDREDCAREIAKVTATATHALAEAKAARSEVIDSVTRAAKREMLAVHSQAVAEAGSALQAGQQEIIGRLDRIETAVKEK